ncbi:sulfurtransferase complex subunit TusB [Pokkaliibacter sp. CJK22405]|uniref:sulfurtransferase complex subunit TusB n=1 Tax=Pokkaliibacter sp. CJK22405 TaxID=3384615 RepID=UPI0039854939
MLHILHRSPQSGDFKACLGRIDPATDDILLIADAVYAVLTLNMPEGISLYALERDLKARGVTANAAVMVIDDAGFVALTEKHSSSLSW